MMFSAMLPDATLINETETTLDTELLVLFINQRRLPGKPKVGEHHKVLMTVHTIQTQKLICRKSGQTWTNLSVFVATVLIIRFRFILSVLEDAMKFLVLRINAGINDTYKTTDPVDCYEVCNTLSTKW